MRTARIGRFCCALSLAALVQSGCSNKKSSESGAASTLNAAVLTGTEALTVEEQALLSQRDQLQRERKSVTETREKIEQRRKALAGGGADDLAALEAENAKALEDERTLREKERAFDEKLNSLLARKNELMAQATAALGSSPGDQTSQVRAREAALALREKDVAAREARFADREREIAQRESEMMKGCAASPAQVVIQAPADPKGIRYGREDAEPIYQKALATLTSKGILDADLPTAASSLKDDAQKAMKKGDFARAKYAAEQLLAIAKAISVDRAFIGAKFTRVSARVRGKKLSSEQKGWFEEATANYGDGKFSSANQKLNKILASVK